MTTRACNSPIKEPRKEKRFTMSEFLHDDDVDDIWGNTPDDQLPEEITGPPEELEKNIEKPQEQNEIEQITEQVEQKTKQEVEPAVEPEIEPEVVPEVEPEFEPEVESKTEQNQSKPPNQIIENTNTVEGRAFIFRFICLANFTFTNTLNRNRFQSSR